MTGCEDESCAGWAGRDHTVSCKVAMMDKLASAERNFSKGEIAFHLKTLDASDKVMAKVDAKIIRQLQSEIRHLRRKAEAVRIVIAPLSVKANVSAEKLISLLEEAERALLAEGARP